MQGPAAQLPPGERRSWQQSSWRGPQVRKWPTVRGPLCRTNLPRGSTEKGQMLPEKRDPPLT